MRNTLFRRDTADRSAPHPSRGRAIFRHDGPPPALLKRAVALLASLLAGNVHKFCLAAGVIGLLWSDAAQATTYYWDTNSAAGFGSVTGGWNGTNNFWNTDSTGATSGTFIASPTSADDLNISAGTAGTITITGTGAGSSLTLSDNVANTITGGTLALGGTGTSKGLFVTSAVTTTTAVASAITLNAAATTIQNAGTGVLTVSGGITGAQNLILNNNGSTANAITISTGSLNNTGTVTNSGTGSGAVLISSVIGANVSGLTQNSATSTLTLTNTANAFTGAINISAGTLAYTGQGSADPTVLGAGAKTITLSNGGILSPTSTSDPNAGTKSFAISTGGGTFNVATGVTFTLNDANQLSGSGDLTITGAGTGVVSLGNSYTGFTGNVNVNSATLKLTNANAVGNTAGKTITVANGAVLDVQASTIPQNLVLNGTGISSGGALLSSATGATLSGTVTLASGSSIGGTSNITLSGAIGETGGSQNLTKVGANTLTLSNAGNNYSGGTNINAGVLNFTTGGLGTTGAITFTGSSTLQYGASTTTDLSSRLAINNGVTGTIDTGANSITLATGFGASGSGALTKAGAGTLTFTGANTYTGLTTASSGTLLLNTAGANGTTTVAIPGNLTIGTASTAGVVQLGGSNEIVNTANLNFGTTNFSYIKLMGFNQTFATVNGGGSAVIENTESDSGVTTNSTLTINGSGSSNYSGYMRDRAGGTSTGKLAIYKDGAGTMTVSSAAGLVSYTGATTVNGGVLQLNTANAALGQLAGTPSITINNGATLKLNAGDVLGYTNNLEALTINSGGTVNNITSASRVTLSNALTMTGGTLAGTGTGDANGVFSITTSGGAAGGSIVATSDASGNPATINATSISPQGGNLTLNVTRGALTPTSDLNISSNIIPYGGTANGIIKTGTGIATLSGTNTFTGATTVSGGTLILSNSLALQNSTLSTGGTGIVFSSSVGSHAFTFGGLSGSTDLALTDNGSNNVTLSVGNNNSSTSYSGVLSAAGGITKIGTGTLTLSGASNYTGTTSVSAGTLAIGAGGSLSNTPIAVTGTATFQAAPGTSAGNTGTPSAGATLNLGSGTTFTLTGASIGNFNLTQESGFGAATTALTLAGATLNFDLNTTANGGADRLVVSTGKAAVSGTNNINFNTSAASSLTNGGTYTVISANQGVTGTFQFASGLQHKTVTVGSSSYDLLLANSATAETVTVADITGTGLTWTGRVNGGGTANNTWDNTTGTNWATGSLATTYADGVAVTFNDTNAVGGSAPTGTVSIQAAGVSPASTTFNNSTIKVHPTKAYLVSWMP